MCTIYVHIKYIHNYYVHVQVHNVINVYSIIMVVEYTLVSLMHLYVIFRASGVCLCV